MNKVVPSDFGRGCILLTLQELRFVWSESEELMLEFAESVPFYGNMGRPQVDMGLSSKDQGSNGSNGNKTHHQQLWWESQMSSTRFGKCNSKFSKGSDFGKCCSMLFPSSLCKSFARFYAIGLYDGIHFGGSAFSAVQAASCWAMGFMRPAARVVRSEQMSRLSWIIAEGGSTFLIFYFKSLIVFILQLSKNHVDLMETPICRPSPCTAMNSTHFFLQYSRPCFPPVASRIFLVFYFSPQGFGSMDVCGSWQGNLW